MVVKASGSLDVCDGALRSLVNRVDPAVWFMTLSLKLARADSVVCNQEH